ncbi:hypothetical protein [Paraburkholderia sp. DGU8]|uniref:hypothetical protein n=1 Tax=Paraburkholderia sp. DGU8 TaxID=3161997 RepID=UPI003467706C
MSRTLIPVGRWKADAHSVNDQPTIRLCGRAFPNVWRVEQQVETVVLTQDQAQELVTASATSPPRLEHSLLDTSIYPKV